ncbi:phosphoribosylamine/glycine ligase [Sediminispirochaeta smaragdinae DSM 11293]|uniref:phosphoribosylamine--glycine ligase n=1 Tax=Sediminispirochaeta smaragdinae (strain DSM 11293 / JCM 15392 / SEBR 4228) TaxID=573413 RepID=E1R5G3_SEDSS|nr:phosphoribosylamine--glycine ligase [Sediminispirochaeta smaragdinae]ADK82291.1 phosphoribosylamine/glycine ligase [Sediminispirochaeta smaragdinae DSM 11293]
MRVLVLGSGAKEHAVTWMFSKSHRICGLYIAPGNAGTNELGENLKGINPADPEQVAEACSQWNIDYVFCGIEDALENGMVDLLQKRGIPTFGAPKATTRLEADKAHGKAFMKRYGIPSTAGTLVTNASELERAIQENSGRRLIIKKNGLSRWKAMFDSDQPEKLLEYGSQLLEKDSILLEQYHVGISLSIFALTDGNGFLVLPPCADYKRAKENDQGPATNGMGAICPVPPVSKQTMDLIRDTIIGPSFEGLKQEGLMYKGVLFFSVVLTAEGPKLIEYHVRFGDPEAQVLFSLIKSDFGNVVEAIENETIDSFPMQYNDNSAVGVVIASEGYPGETEKEIPLKRIPAFPEKETLVFHGSTRVGEKGETLSTSGRCFTVVGLGNNIVNANTRAYEAVKRIRFDGAWYRNDIGNAFFED